jgi:hypothetical protein
MKVDTTHFEQIEKSHPDVDYSSHPSADESTAFASVSPEIDEAMPEYGGSQDSLETIYQQAYDDWAREQLEAQARWETEKFNSELRGKDADIWPVRRAMNRSRETKMVIPEYVPGFVFAGALNAIIGAAKAGKSTLTWSMLDAAMRGQAFMGVRKCPQSKVLYVSEQHEVSFERQIESQVPKEMALRLMNNPNFYELLPEDHTSGGTPSERGRVVTKWEDRLALWKMAIDKVQPNIFVLDTFGSYADFPLGGENDNAMMCQRLMDLGSLREKHPAVAILILHHITKTAETQGGMYLKLNAIRGGSAFAAGLDHCVTLNRYNSSPGFRRRSLAIISRLCEEQQFIVEWQADGSYRKVEEDGTAKANKSGVKSQLTNVEARRFLEKVQYENPNLKGAGWNKLYGETKKMDSRITQSQVRAFCQLSLGEEPGSPPTSELASPAEKPVLT